MLKRQIALTTIGGVLLAATAIAQTSAPSPSPPSASPPAAATESAKPPEQNLAAPGKWRASKLMGVDIYGADDKKVGDVTEVVLDKGGKIETVTIGVGGFLGIGSKDIAIPFEQITWSDEPMVQAAPAPAPSSGSGGMTGASPTPPAAAAPKGPTMYPDHGKISMTKEQLTSAPAVTYAAR